MEERKEFLIRRLDKLINRELFKELTLEEREEKEKVLIEYNEILTQEARDKAQEKAEKSREMKQRRGRGRYGEQRLAKKVGGIVVGRSKAVKLPSGKYIKIDCQRPCDVVTEIFSFESKWRKNVPKFLDKLMAQAQRNCPSGLTPVGVIGDREARVVYYIMTENDFLSWHGNNKGG